MLAAIAFIFGLAWGSFANVVIYRIPRAQSVSEPRRSHCPHCDAEIAWYDNLPVASYVMLRGRCRSCSERISARYPLVELLMGLVWAAAALQFGLSWHLPAFIAFGTVLLVISIIDLEHKRIPNKVLGPGAILALVLFLIAAIATASYSDLPNALMGALAYSVPLFVLAVAVPKGMGMGDVKLAAYIGLHLGWLGLSYVAVGAFSGFVLGGLGGVGMLLAGRSRKSAIPFGPFMALGAVVAIVITPAVLRFLFPF